MSKQIVFLLTHVDKYGTANGVYGSRDKAQASALELMTNRMLSDWYPEDVRIFDGITSFYFKDEFFHQIESTVSDGQTISIVEREVQ